MFQLRLGWLVPLVELAAERHLDRARVGQALLQLATATAPDGEELQDAWLRDAGLEKAPQGRNSTRASDELARMGVVYGVYDPVAQAPTDLGRVLDHVGRGQNPFSWPASKRLIGLRILLGTDGDVALALLRGWPDAPSEVPAGIHVRRILLALAEKARDKDRALLERQASRERPRDLVHPRLEPLRELGLVTNDVASGGYVRTPVGKRFIVAAGGANADELIDRGLVRVLFACEALSPGPRADPAELLETLRFLPPGLRGATNEAPLEPVALLTQARLLASGRYETLELADAREVVTELGVRTGGKFGLKAGSTAGHENVTWTDDAVLSAPLPLPPPTPSGSAPPREAASPTGDGGRPAPAALGQRAPPAAPEASTPPALAGATSQPAVPAPPAAAADLPALLWLTYLLRLLDRASLGAVDALAYGGPRSWADGLLASLVRPAKVLNAARRPDSRSVRSDSARHPWMGTPLATQPFRRWCHDVKVLGGWLLPFCAALDEWDGGPRPDGRGEEGESPRDVEALRVALKTARTSADRLAGKLGERVRAFLASPRVDAKEWAVVRALTRATTEDLLAQGGHARDELFSKISGDMRGRPTQLAAVAAEVADELCLQTDKREWLYAQGFVVPAAVLAEVDALPRTEPFFSVDREEVSVTRAGRERAVEVTVQLLARTSGRARVRGEEYAREALARLSFAASRRLDADVALPAPWRVEPGDTGRLSHNGLPEPLLEPVVEMPQHCPRPEGLGFAGAVPRSITTIAAGLPTLARTRAGGLDARTRLARTLHWLSLADQLDATSPERLGHAWTAVEHLVSAGTDSKGREVVRQLSAIGAVELMIATGGDIYRECLAALHVNACHRPGDAVLINALCDALGAEERARYASLAAGTVVPRRNMSPPAAQATIPDTNALDMLLRWHGRLPSIAQAVEPHAPFAAQRVRDFWDWTQDKGSLSAVSLLRWLRTLHADVATLLQHVYDLRNQLVHEADPFVFESHRMDELYRRFRLVIDPLVARLLRGTAEQSDLAQLIAEEAAVFARLEIDLQYSLAEGGDRGPRITFALDLDRLLTHLPAR